MNENQKQLFAILDRLGIEHKTHTHEAIFTVEQGKDIKEKIAGGHTKNLFLKDKNAKLVLVCALGSTKIRINQLHKHIGCKRLSFAKPDIMKNILGVEPGSVCFFAIMNDKNTQVQLVLDKALFEHDIVNFHPLKNTATTSIKAKDMLKFAKEFNHEPLIVDFTLI